MNIGTVIAENRKKLGLTQDALAQQLGVTNQAVSKWESDQSCPDIALLPGIADIFGITLDELFGREAPKAEPVALVPAAPELPWADDGTLRIAAYRGHTYLADFPERQRITFEYKGAALNVECAVNLACDDVNGNISAGGDVSCDTVYGSVEAGGTVSCDEVMGSVSAGGDVSCDAVDGNVNAGGNVSCDEVAGHVSAGMDVTCDEVEGNVFCGRDVTCDKVCGSITAGGTVTSDGDNQSRIRFSMGGKGKKNQHVHITADGTEENADEDPAEDELEDTIENKINKFVNDIVRRSTNFRF